MSVEKRGEENFSAGIKSFPQVFHNSLWNEKGLIYKRLGGFFTFTQDLLLVLDSYKRSFKNLVSVIGAV